MLDGASHGRQFKARAPFHDVMRFWFSALQGLHMVDQIERQARIADGLRKLTLTPKEAAEWARICDPTALNPRAGVDRTARLCTQGVVVSGFGSLPLGRGVALTPGTAAPLGSLR